MAVGATVDKLRRSGVEVIDFGAGEPDFGTPDAIKLAAHKALDAEFTKYTPVPGIAELRRAVCDRYKTDYGVEYTESQVILTAGGKQALYNTALALFGPGDEVITHQPYWPTIVEQVKLADATPVAVETRPEDGFAIHADKVLRAITPRTRGIIINSPCNPTGALIAEADLTAIAEAAGKQGIWLVVDLCYERLIYDNVRHNIPRILAEKCPETAVICGSASKAYAMTGWRCGWTIGPAKMIAACNAIQSHATSNVNSITQTGRRRGADRRADPGQDDARRISDAPRQPLRMADGRSARKVPEAGRRVLHVPRPSRSHDGWRLQDVDRIRDGAPRREARRGHAWRGV